MLLTTMTLLMILLLLSSQKVTGKVIESLPNATFRVEIEPSKQVVFATISGKIRKNQVITKDGYMMTSGMMIMTFIMMTMLTIDPLHCRCASSSVTLCPWSYRHTTSQGDASLIATSS